VTLDRPPDPIQSGGPLAVPRRRPGPVTLAGVLLCAGGAVGLAAALALLVSAAGVVNDFRDQALALSVPSSQAASAAAALRTALLTSGAGALALSGVSVVLGWGVLGRNALARIAALVVCAASLGCAVVRTGVTALGRSVDWSTASGSADPAVTERVAQAFDAAMPSWLVGLGGGLTDLQSLGNVLVLALLLAPASVLYFRR
jgi:hypothetical protein